MNMISVKNLTKVFTVYKKQGFFKSTKEKITAVSDISFDVDEGEILAFIGPNGAGKSTTIKMLTGILTPTYGNIDVMGMNPQKDRKKLAYNVGTVFGQKSQLWFHLPPRDSFELIGSIYDIPPTTLRSRIDKFVEIMDIGAFYDIPVRKLSLGQRIRCEITASLLHKPKIIFLDEPTIGLDVIAKNNLRNIIKRINREEKTTIFLTSHDMGDIEKLCRRMIIINLGAILMDDYVNNLKYNYDNKKIISIKYDGDVSFDFDDIKILNKSKNACKVEIDTNKHAMDEIVSRLFRIGKVLDISISSKPLEDIISEIYTKKAVL